ncbi:MAG: SPOR domain-containing protein [Bacteroidaceae bacterium]|nr:SPOR domain-containing protein [Bacteroidaceae bacterium]
MKKTSFFLVCIAAAMALTGCKSRESAFAQAYQQALDEENSRQPVVTEPVQPVVTQPVQPVVAAQPVQPIQPVQPVVEEEVELTDLRTIDGQLDVVSGDALKTYSVVVGSFITKSNADGLMATLRGQGYDARVVRTNETINGRTGWYRVVASSTDLKSEAARLRDTLKGKYPGAWLLLKR